MDEDCNWSDGRNVEKDKGLRKRNVVNGIGRVNASLAQLADDPNFQQDLKVPEVTTAIRHWTGEKRLSELQSAELFDEDSYAYQTHIRPCLMKLTKIQHECRQIGIAIPLNGILNGHRSLPSTKKHEQMKGKKSPGKRKVSSARVEDTNDDVDSGKSNTSSMVFVKRQILQTLLMVVVFYALTYFKKSPSTVNPKDIPRNEKDNSKQDPVVAFGEFMEGDEDEFSS